MTAPTLAQTQQLLWTLITAPEGAASGLARLSAAELTVAQGLVRGNRRLSAVERLDVYADMYFYRIRDCLAEDFPAVRHVIGQETFHNLVTDYLIVRPPSHFSLRNAGQYLPTFLCDHGLSRRWPFLSDLALLEWSIIEAFDAPDATPLGAAALRDLPVEDWPEARFTLMPSLQILHVGWPVHDVWQQTQLGESISAPTPQRTAIRVWRQNLRVFHRAMDAVETAALDAVKCGMPFAEVCGEIVTLAGETAGTERAYALLATWMSDELLTGFSAA
jgi:hypothetical protein